MTRPAEFARDADGIAWGLDAELPERLKVPASPSLYVSGWILDTASGRPVRDLELVCGNQSTRTLAERMPRTAPVLDGRRPARIGFWGLITLAGGSGVHEVRVRGRRGGRTVEIVIGRTEVEVLTPERPAPRHDPYPRVVICMATYEPDPQQLSQQLESLKRQTYQNWTCVISDDASSSVVKRQLADQVDGDPRFTVLHHTRRVGFYRNFETCLTHVPSKANLVAFCDQDDRWHADKLETLVETIRKRPETMLVYSDMRLVNASGRVLRDSLWGLARRNNATDLGRLMCANSVTGAASLFRRELLAVALPFPNVGAQYHDHWLAILALATGDLTFVSRPLHDYVQHARNVVGARGRPRSQKQGRFDPERWYFTRVIGGMIFAREALARAGAVMAPEKRRVLERIALLDGVSGLSWLAGRAIRHPAETRAIKMIAGDLWRRTLSIRWPGNWQVLQVSDSALPARIVPLGG